MIQVNVRNPQQRPFTKCPLGHSTRRGLRRVTIDVSNGDLQAIAERGYEGAASTEPDQQAQAVGLFLTDALFANLAA